jgi:hypothetical protein
MVQVKEEEKQRERDEQERVSTRLRGRICAFMHELQYLYVLLSFVLSHVF